MGHTFLTVGDAILLRRRPRIRYRDYQGRTTERIRKTAERLEIGTEMAGSSEERARSDKHREAAEPGQPADEEHFARHLPASALD